MDFLVNKSEVIQDDIDDLWNKILFWIRDWKGATVNDRTVIVDTVFRIVRKLLCHHWDVYHSKWLYGLFNKTIERLGHKDENEVKLFQRQLSKYSEELSDWINNDYDGHLSEDIETILKAQSAEEKQIKPKGGRKAIDPSDITASFNYLPREAHRIERLQAFFNCLNNTFVIADMKDFVDIFQNKTTTKKVLWIRDIIELKYLINQLDNSKWITHDGYTKWQITCARFQIRMKDKENDSGSHTNDSYIIEDLKLSQFSSGKKAPKNNPELDRIIKILDPQTDFGSALEDYLDYKDAQGEHDEIKDTADALANGLNTDIHL